jgi:ribosomal subunit interface protein
MWYLELQFPPYPMNVQHFEKGLVYTDRELLVLARKIGKLATYCRQVKDEASSIRVEAEQRETKKERDKVKVMITVELPGKILRAESRRDEVIDALDRCIEKLEPQIAKYKDLHTGKGLATARRKRRKESELLAAA